MTNLRALFGLVVLGVMFAILMSAPLWAQQGSDSGTGFPEHGVFHGTSVESTQLNNGNSHIEIPLVHVVGRGGVAYYVKLMLDTKSMFYSDDHCAVPGVDRTCKSTIKPVPHPELFVFDNTTHAPFASRDIVTIQTTCVGMFGGTNSGLAYRVSFTDPNGSKHQMLPLEITSNNDPCKLAPIVSQMYAADGSGWTLRVDPNTAAIHGAFAKDGTNPSQDANGNYLTPNVGSVPPTVTDSAGRVLPRPYMVRDSSGNLQYQAVPYIDSSGQTQVIQVTYTTTTVSTHLCQYAPYSCTEATGLTVPSQIIFPKSPGAVNSPKYTFSWSQNDYGEPLSLTLPEGGVITWTYSVLDSSGRRVATRTVSDGTTSGTWSYDYGTPANPGTIDANYPYTIITDPNGKATRHTCTYLAANPYAPNTSFACHITKVESFDGDVNAPLLKSVQTALSATFPYLPIRETTCLAQTSQCAKWEKDYDSFSDPSFGNPPTTSFGNVIAFREFDYGTGSPGPLLRTTQSHFLYQDNANYLNTGLLDRPAYSKVYDGNGNIVAQTSFTYDGSPLTATSGVPGHDYTNFGANNPTRGNLTQVSHWRNTDGSWISTSHAYDDLGNLRSTTDPNGNATSFSYDDNWANTICVPAGVNTLVYATQVTNALNQKTKAAYYPCTGLVQARQNQNDMNAGRTGTTFTYDLMNRPLAVNLPDGGQTAFNYNGDTLPLKTTKTVVATPAPSIVTSTVHDGLGRVSQSRLDSDPAGVDYTDTTYDALSRVATVSNLYRTTSDPTYGITQSQYDALGRATQITKQDGSISTVSYLGNCTTATDEAGKARKACSDALGRLTSVWEDPAGLNYETDYQYDTLGNLLRVDQKGSAPTDSGKWRTRLFTYNSLSQLLTANNPESGTITYSYDADGNMTSKTSPAPNQIGSATITANYVYDALHRLTSKSYSDGSPTVYYLYDSVPWYTSANSVGRLVETYNGVNDASFFRYDAAGRVVLQNRYTPSNQSSAANPVSASYNLAGDLTSLTYPDGEVVTYTPNSAGRIQSVVDSTNNINYVTGASYGPDSALTGFVSGASGSFTGINNAYSYNKRLQAVNMSASSPSQTVFSIGYDFHLGNGTSGTDNGNVWGITNYKDSSRNQSFTYDALNRLTSAQNAGTNCATTTVNGKTEYWGNSYGYDAWGNLLAKTVTKCSAENLSITALTNNRLSGYTYDAAGNMSADPTDGVTLVYDAENRISTATKNGATTSYTYDADGERVRKDSGGPATEYLSFNGQTLAEKNLSTGAWTNYVFFDGERVARREAAGVFYYFSDHLKTASVITDSAGTIKSESDYYPWGGELQFLADDSNHYKFTGKERDSESGLDYFGARYYSNGLGRFISADWSATPIPVPYADFGDPQSLNQYSYVRNIPTVNVDPDGHQCPPCEQAIEKVLEDPQAFSEGLQQAGKIIAGIGAGAAAGWAWSKGAAADFIKHMPSESGGGNMGTLGQTNARLNADAAVSQDAPADPKRPGTLGKPDHQETVKDEAKRIGGDKEVTIQTPGGSKDSRRADAAQTDANGNYKPGGKIVQVIRPTKAGNVPKREKDAAQDIQNATGVKPELVPVRPLPKKEE